MLLIHTNKEQKGARIMENNIMENKNLSLKDLKVLSRINAITARGKYNKAPGVLRKLNRYTIKNGLQTNFEDVK
jgi:hypothetical protein